MNGSQYASETSGENKPSDELLSQSISFSTEAGYLDKR